MKTKRNNPVAFYEQASYSNNKPNEVHTSFIGNDHTNDKINSANNNLESQQSFCSKLFCCLIIKARKNKSKCSENSFTNANEESKKLMPLKPPSIQIIEPPYVFIPKFIGNPIDDFAMLDNIRKNLKPIGKVFLNFNRYKIEWSNCKMLQDLAYEKNALGKMIEIVKELSAKAQELIFTYSNNELQYHQCNQLLQLGKQYPKHFFSYYNYVINFGKKNKDFNKLNTQIAQLTKDQFVYLHFHARRFNFGNNESNKIAFALNSFKNLSRLYLNLASNNIRVEGAIKIGQALQNCQNLSNLFLNLRGNKINKEGAIQIATALKNCSKITSLELYLWDTDIGNDGAIEIADALKMLSNMFNLVLGLQKINLRDTGATAIANALITFAHSPTITLLLGLGGNKIGDSGATQIATALRCFNGLSRLDLYLDNNIIGNAGAIDLASALKNFKNLSYLELDLSDNKYTEDVKKYFQELQIQKIKIQKP